MRRHIAFAAGLLTAAAILAAVRPAVAEVVYVSRSNNTITALETTTGVETLFSNSALLNNPTGIGVDAVGNVFVVNKGNDTIVKISPTGNATLFASSASLGNAQGLTLDNAGNIYVANFDNNSIIKVTAGGAVSTLTTDAALAGPVGLVYRNGYLYAATGEDNVLKIDVTGVNPSTVFASALTGAIPTTLLTGVTFDKAGNLLVTSSYDNQISPNAPNAVAKYDSNGANGSLFAYGYVSDPSGNITGPDQHLFNPAGIVVDENGNVYVANSTFPSGSPYNDPSVNTLEKFGPGGGPGSVVGNFNGQAGNLPGFLAISAVPEPSVFVEGGLMLSLAGAAMGWRRFRTRRAG